MAINYTSLVSAEVAWLARGLPRHPPPRGKAKVAGRDLARGHTAGACTGVDQLNHRRDYITKDKQLSPWKSKTEGWLTCRNFGGKRGLTCRNIHLGAKSGQNATWAQCVWKVCETWFSGVGSSIRGREGVICPICLWVRCIRRFRPRHATTPEGECRPLAGSPGHHGRPSLG